MHFFFYFYPIFDSSKTSWKKFIQFFIYLSKQCYFHSYFLLLFTSLFHFNPNSAKRFTDPCTYHIPWQIMSARRNWWVLIQVKNNTH